MTDPIRTLPEIYESVLSECLTARTKTLAKYANSLGPPDLCHITKIQDRPQSLLRSGPAPPTLVGTYHFAYGVDCSSPAAIAAYFNTLVNEVSKTGNASKGVWRIQSGTYCSYNAFTRVDVRVEVTMPGSVNAYVLDAQGRRYGCDDRMWQEVLICSTLRALSRPNIFTTHIDGLRSFYPFQRPEDEELFLKAAEDLFWDGRFLGTDELTAPVTVTNNRLAVGLKDYFYSTCRFSKCMDFFLKFLHQDAEIATLVADVQSQFGQTSAAICMLSRQLKRTPMSYAMLVKQSQLLVDMGEAHKALEVARYAVDLCPAQAGPWINLARVYVACRNYGMALVALNVAPMSHGHEFVMPEMPEPARMVGINEVIRDMVSEEDDGDQTLANLPANSLQGTFLDAYQVLTRMLRDISWDELLMYRTQVFLMEDAPPAHDPPASGDKDEQKSEGGASGAHGGKRLLERWLDQLFTALYQDLMCSVIWNAQEQHAAKTGAKVDHTIGDLLRFGYLSQRLGRKDDAVKAFQQCTSQGFCLRGLLAVLDTYANDGFVEETLATVDAICAFGDLNPDLLMPPEVTEAVFKLVSKHGVALMNQLGGKWVSKSPHVKKLIDRAVLWKVRGYNK